MSEKVVILRHSQHCDLCHQKIHAGEKARIIRDDFGTGLVWFEHLRCPDAPAVNTGCPLFSVPKRMMFA